MYRLQHTTEVIAAALRNLAPKGARLNSYFEEILQAGASGKEFDVEQNKEWTLHTRPIIEAFFHARYFLDAAVKASNELETSKEFQGWGGRALLSLYNLWTY